MKVPFVNIIISVCLLSANNVMASAVTYNMDIFVDSSSAEFSELTPRYPASIYPASVDLDGLPQFDPSLGTLNKVTFIFSGDFSYSLSNPTGAFRNNVIDEAAPNSMSTNLDLGIALSEGFASRVLTVASPGFSCSAGAFEGTCTANVGENITSTLFLEQDSSVIDDFIGTGDLGYLRVELFASNDGGFVSNIEYDTVQIDMVYDGQVSVEYDFASATVSVPEPGTLLLMGMGLAGLAIRRRCPQGDRHAA